VQAAARNVCRKLFETQSADSVMRC